MIYHDDGTQTFLIQFWNASSWKCNIHAEIKQRPMSAMEFLINTGSFLKRTSALCCKFGLFQLKVNITIPRYLEETI